MNLREYTQRKVLSIRNRINKDTCPECGKRRWLYRFALGRACRRCVIKNFEVKS